MKHFILKQIAERFSEFRRLTHIKRVGDNLIELEFDMTHYYLIDLTKSNSNIYKKNRSVGSKSYSAPFDKSIARFLNNSYLKEASVLPDDRVLQLLLESCGSYKSTCYTLRIEFTGRNTNAIITDKNDVVIDALRYIDSARSSREVRIGRQLAPIPSFAIREQPFAIEDIDRFLEKEYEIYEQKQLQKAKDVARNRVLKRQKALLIELSALEDAATLKTRSEQLYNDANLLLYNINDLESYKREHLLKDYSGDERRVTLPKEARNAKDGINILFAKAKRLVKKSKNIHIERKNLEDKIHFHNLHIAAINAARSLDELALYAPKKQTQSRKSGRKEGFESFFIEGYKVYVGKNERENEAVLKKASPNDIWFHIQDFPSSHLVIATAKQKLGENILLECAKMCVNFSTDKPGRYIVDYTKRKYVKIKEKANVLYTDYKSLVIIKDI